MKKIDQKAEKRIKNEEFALKYSDKKRSRKKRASQWKNWCGTPDHPSDCNCIYPSREELYAAHRKR